MKNWFFGAILLAVSGAGCVSKSAANAQARAAFLAGQQQAFASDPRRVNIRIVGPVRHPEVQWTDGLTLAQAIATAEHEGNTPSGIMIVRSRGRFPINPNALLNGQDIPLEPGDTVEIYP